MNKQTAQYVQSGKVAEPSPTLELCTCGSMAGDNPTCSTCQDYARSLRRVRKLWAEAMAFDMYTDMGEDIISEPYRK